MGLFRNNWSGWFAMTTVKVAPTDIIGLASGAVFIGYEWLLHVLYQPERCSNKLIWLNDTSSMSPYLKLLSSIVRLS
ncbi:hypothetical protein TNCV_306971 [Trichonephila clavipes]|nr:hypothetical protein TNCV_306971 [Trichonephila clavipes]